MLYSWIHRFESELHGAQPRRSHFTSCLVNPTYSAYRSVILIMRNNLLASICPLRSYQIQSTGTCATHVAINVLFALCGAPTCSETRCAIDSETELQYAECGNRYPMGCWHIYPLIVGSYTPLKVGTDTPCFVGQMTPMRCGTHFIGNSHRKWAHPRIMEHVPADLWSRCPRNCGTDAPRSVEHIRLGTHIAQWHTRTLGTGTA